MIQILGSGMSALVAAEALKKHSPVVFESAPKGDEPAPRRMRFGSPALGELFEIPFEQVLLQKAYEKWQNPVADALALAQKCYGKYVNSIELHDLPTYGLRYLAPKDLLQRIRSGIEISYESDISLTSKQPTVSTLPMPVLMQKLGYKCDIEFRRIPMVVARATVADCEAYASLLLPNPQLPASRILLIGDEIEVEFPRPQYDELTALEWLQTTPFSLWETSIQAASERIGLDPNNVSNVKVEFSDYGKPGLIDNRERVKFLNWARMEHNVFCVGRYAQWWSNYSIENTIAALAEIDQQLENGGKLN